MLASATVADSLDIDLSLFPNPAPHVCQYETISPNRTNWFAGGLSYTLSTMQFWPNRKQCRQHLNKLARLQHDWDGYGAEVIDSLCIANADRVLSVLDPDIPSPDITPNPNGTLTLDWETDTEALSFEIGVRRYSSFWESRSGMETDQGDLPSGLPFFVSIALSNLFPDTQGLSQPYQESIFDAPGPPAGTIAHNGIG